jgi:putative flippase GtrA
MKPADEATTTNVPAVHEPTGAADWTWRLVRRVHLGTRKPTNWIQLFKFGVVGVSGYVVNLIVFAILVEALGLHHVLGAVGAFCIAVMNNFLWNRHWTFRATHGHAGFQAARFFAVSLAALGVNLVVLSLLVDVADAPEVPSQAFAVAFAMPLNFIGNKLWTFGRD